MEALVVGAGAGRWRINNMEKLFHLLPTLEGERFSTTTGVTGEIQAFTGVRFGNVVMDNGTVRRMSIADTVTG